MKSATWLACGFVAAGMILFPVKGRSQVMFTGSYTQNFNTLSSASSATWTDNTTLTGWYATPTALTISNGSTNVGGLVNYGSTSSSNRALGGDGGATFGIRLRNNSGVTITSFTLSYTGEQWRAGALNVVPSDQVLAFSYSTNATSLSTGTYTAVTALDFYSITDSSTLGTALNGTQVANQIALSSTINSLSWANGTDLWVKWTDADDALVEDHGMAADNVSVSATVPEPSTMVYLLLGIGSLAVLRRIGGKTT